MGGGVWDVGLWQADSKLVPNDPHFPVFMLLCNPLPECGQDRWPASNQHKTAKVMDVTAAIR